MRRVLLLALIAMPLHAARFRVLFDGQPVEGAEVCVWRATDVVCRDAAADLSLADGRWNAIARKGTELISERTTIVTASDKPIDLIVVPAARVTPPATREGETLFAYLPRTRSAIPLRDALPTRTQVIPFTLGKSTRVGNAVMSDEHLTLDDAPGTIATITIESVPRDGEGPTVLAVDKDKTRPPILPLRKVAKGEVHLLFFHGAAEKVTLTGARWKSAEATEPFALTAVTVSKVTVHWWTAAQLDEVRRFKATLLRCLGQKNGLDSRFVRTDTCESVATQELPLDAVSGTFTLTSVPPGLYFLRFERGERAALDIALDVQDDDSVDAELRWFTFYGKVTKRGAPQHARVFDTETDPVTGEYHAFLARQPGRLTSVRVEAIDESWAYEFVPDDAIRENAPFDIEIPDNHIDVLVTDAATGAPLEKANITYSALIDGEQDATHFAGMTAGTTDASGHVLAGPFLANKRVRICAGHVLYKTKCEAPRRIAADEDSTLTFALKKSDTTEGHIIAPGSIENGWLWWNGPDGTRIERVRVARDGTFGTQVPHHNGEIVSLVSTSLPFFATTYQAGSPDEPIQIRIPAARVRRYSVSLASTSTEEAAFHTIALGDLVVPGNTFSQHLMMRGQQPSLQPGSTTAVPEIYETAPLSILLAPMSFWRAHSGVPDIFFLPESRTLPRELLGERDHVEFR